MIRLELLDRAGIAWAQDVVTKHHYLHRPVDSRVSLEGYRVMLAGIGRYPLSDAAAARTGRRDGFPCRLPV